MPCGDRLPYDVGIDFDGGLLRIQVRRAWPTRGRRGGSYKIDVRRSLTNRFYVIPSRAAVKYASGITFNDDPARKTRALPYRNAWALLGIKNSG